MVGTWAVRGSWRSQNPKVRCFGLELSLTLKYLPIGPKEVPFWEYLIGF